jgi:hypothetical protein
MLGMVGSNQVVDLGRGGFARYDVGRQGRDGTHNFRHRLGWDPGRGQRVTQVPSHPVEVAHGDPATLMHVLHRCTGVGLGPAESGRKPDVEILDDDYGRVSAITLLRRVIRA